MQKQVWKKSVQQPELCHVLLGSYTWRHMEQHQSIKAELSCPDNPFKQYISMTMQVYVSNKA